MAFEFSLDAITSVFVVWRFKEPKDPNLSATKSGNTAVRSSEAEEQRRLRKLRRDLTREKRANIAVGVAFLASAFVLVFSATYKLAKWTYNGHEQEQKEAATFSEIIAWPCFFLFGAFAAFKLNLSKELKSEVLKKDAIASGLASVMSGVVIIVGILEWFVSWAWVFDPMAGLLIAAILGLEGVRTVHENLDEEEGPNSLSKHHQIMT